MVGRASKGRSGCAGWSRSHGIYALEEQPQQTRRAKKVKLEIGYIDLLTLGTERLMVQTRMAAQEYVRRRQNCE